MKCDEARPTCAMCKASQLVCSGYEKSIFFGAADAGTWTGGGKPGGRPAPRFRRHLLTESERRAMSETIRSDIPPAQALGNIAEIDDRCDDESSRDDFQITRGPFGAFRLSSSISQDSLPDELEPLEPAMTWGSTAESTEEVSPTSLDAITADDLEDVEDIIPQGNNTLAPLSPLSIGAILNDLDSPLIECSGLPWLPLNDLPMTDGRVQDVSDDMPWVDIPSSPAIPNELRGIGLNFPPLDALSIPQTIHQDVPHDAVFLLKHYSTTVLTSLTPFRHGKTPWHVLFIPHVKSCLAALTLGEKLDHATLCTFYATLALSASSIAGISTSDKWNEQSRIYKQQAHWHALCVLQTAYVVPKVAKYKTMLMALLSMAQVSTMTGDRDQAECFLLESEKFIRIKGLNLSRRKSRKVRLLHHCYVFERFIHESSWPGSSTSAYRRLRIRAEIEDCGAGAFSQDTLGFELTYWGDLDKEMLRSKGQAEGENDLHLQIPGTWPATLYPEIFGVPEIHVFILSMIVRLAQTKENIDSGSGMSIGEFLKRAKSIERMIYQAHSYNLALAEGEATQSQRLLSTLVEAMREALAIFFYKSVYDVEGRLLQANVNRVCDCLRQIDAEDSGFGAVRLLWPALVAAREADDPEARSFFADWFAGCARRSGASIFVDTLARVQLVWAGR